MLEIPSDLNKRNNERTGAMKKILKALSLITIAFVMLFTNICNVSAASWGNNGKNKDNKTNYSEVTLESSYMTTNTSSGRSIVLKFSGSLKSDTLDNTQILLMKGSKTSIPLKVTTSGSSGLVITPNSDLFTHSAYKLYVYGLKDKNNHVIKPFTLVINQGSYSSDDDEDSYDNTSDFTDVKYNFWAYEAIMELVDRGILKGYTDKTFKPDATVTRSEFATMFTKALNLSYSGSTQTFVDVEKSSWDFNAVEAAKYYMTGYRTSDGKMYFYGSNAAVREDMAVALVKALNLTVETNNTVLQQVFKDYGSISANLRDYVYTAYKNGIMIGSNNEFKPQDNLTRAEAATLLQRIINSEKIVIGNGEKVVIGGSNTSTTGDSDARLQYIWINNAQLTSFSADTYVYNVKLPAGTTALPAVSALPINQNGATAVITQTTALPGYSVIVVTSKDKTQTKTYVIYFTVEDQISTDASLKNLTVNGTTVSGFSPDILSYNVTLAKGTTTMQVNAAVNDTEGAKAIIVPAISLPGTATIIVTAEDGVTTRVYTVRFTVAQ